jgi:dihydroneopterin aldolase
MPPSEPYEVVIDGLEAYAYHGVPQSERETGHRYCVSLRVAVVSPAPRSDDVADTIDYGALAELVMGIHRSSAYFTVEALARRIAVEILERFPLAQSVQVLLVKPLPPMPYVVAAAGVELTLTRDSLPEAVQ